jgi:hypothetical protein
MRLSLLAVLAVVFALVAACATAYHPEGAGGGFSDAQIDRNTFRVTFKGSVGSNQGQTDEMALLHAAEVSKAHGYPYFVSSGSAPIGTAITLATSTISSPASTLTISCFTFRPETTAVVYEADRVIATLGGKYPRD